jgi:hypothetical protein
LEASKVINAKTIETRLATMGSMDGKEEKPRSSELGDADMSLLEYLWSLTPAERLVRHEQALELVRALRRAGQRHYGFDPRSPPTAR